MKTGREGEGERRKDGGVGGRGESAGERETGD